MIKNNSNSLYIIKEDSKEYIKPKIVFLIAVACGITVANLYWAQPLLDSIANSFSSSTATAGLIVTLTQIGYAVGLVFLVPLGDVWERRKLIVFVLYISALSLFAASFSPSMFVFMIASLAIGITSVVAQILVPFSATLARDHERGKVVGQVMSGLLLGILLARTFSGFISSFFGWRAVFSIAAVLIILLSIVLRRALPQNKMEVKLTYSQLLKSVWGLVKSEKVLRRRSIYGALMFANFSVLWTSLTFLLANAPYHYSDAIIGLFGLVGASGATSANVAGRLADKGKTNIATGGFLISVLISFILMLVGEHILALLIVGIIILDLGVQGTHILNQSEVYKLHPEARSRITTAYMTSFFIGGSVGSALSALMFHFYNWFGVCLLGILFSLISLSIWSYENISKK